MQSLAERPKSHIGYIIICGLLIFLLMAGAYGRNKVWNSELELWTDCVKKSPNKDRPHNALGNALSKQSNFQEAVYQYTEALRIDPNYSKAHYSLANAYLMIGDRGLALKEFEIFKKMDPDLANALYQKIK